MEVKRGGLTIRISGPYGMDGGQYPLAMLVG